MEPTDSERSVGALVGDLVRETETLVRQEVQLAKTEMSAKAITAARSVALIGAGGAVAHAGLLILLVGLVAALSQVIPTWSAALAVGVVTVCVGYFLVQRGAQALSDIEPAPERTIRTLKEGQLWAKEQLR